MNKISTLKKMVMVICIVMLLAACGQKGDLYLPEGNILASWIG